MIGDPLFEAPLLIVGNSEKLSLCYEVHGHPDTYFNLISHECIFVNALYTQIHDLNVISQIGIRAVTNNGRDYVSVTVTQEDGGCTTVWKLNNGRNWVANPGRKWRDVGDVHIHQPDGNHVSIAVITCEQEPLMMFVACTNANPPMIRFSIAHETNFRSPTHGLLGEPL